jgi:hypothetical protein
VQPSVNFHHPSSRKFPPSVSVLVKYTMDPIQIKGAGTRQLSVRLRFVLL